MRETGGEGGAMDESARSIEVRTSGVAARSEVVVGVGVLDSLGARLLGLTPGRRAMLAVDEGVPGALVESAAGSLGDAGFAVERIGLRATEEAKSLETASRVIDALAAARFERTDALVALGGGIVGDVSGFAAACYRRGIGFVQCPTTLLAMVDASVGGKTGVNLMLAGEGGGGPGGGSGGGMRKNLVGAFHQPWLVLADVRALATLGPRLIRAGLGECVKHAMISAEVDPGLHAWTMERAGGFMGAWPGGAGAGPGGAALEEWTELIARNVAVKRRFVEGDERELSDDPRGSRMLLNLGHTFAHALESVGARVRTAEGEGVALHGEAVLLGLVAASYAGASAGLVEGSFAEGVRRAVESLGMRSRVAGLAADADLIRRMGDDKKASGGRLRVVLPDGPGSARVVVGPAEGVLLAGWASIREGSAVPGPCE